MSTETLRQHLVVLERAAGRAAAHPLLPAELKEALAAAVAILRAVVADMEARREARHGPQT